MRLNVLILAFLFCVFTVMLGGSDAVTDQVEVAALRALRNSIGDGFNRLSNWVGDDPCGSGWTGVICVTINGTDHVQHLQMLNMNFTGTLAPDIGNLTQLYILDFMWNNITGSIPPEIGYLSNLFLLLLNGNQLTGSLPDELGNLSNLNRIQIDQNYISGPIPTTFANLNKAKHFHMNNNSLSGSIPPELGRLESLVHMLLDNNNLSGPLPPELSNISTLLIMQLDNNHFESSIPTNYSELGNLTKLSLRNCNLTGEIPNLSKMTNLGYLDLSHNQLTGPVPSISSNDITTIDLSYNQLDGTIPTSFYTLQTVEFILLRNNSLDGTFNGTLLNHGLFTDASSVLVWDIQENNITYFDPSSSALFNVPNVTLRLYGNPVCSNSSTLQSYCLEYNGVDVDINSTAALIQSTTKCDANTCDASQNQELVYGLLASGSCHCAYPLAVDYRLKSPGFAFFAPYENAFNVYLSSGLNLSDYQVNVSYYNWEPGPRLRMTIKLYPDSALNRFNDSDVLHLKDTFTSWNIPDNNTFGPYEVIAFIAGYPYDNSNTQSSSSGLSGGAIAGIVIGVAAVTAIVVGIFMFFVFRHRRRYITYRKAPHPRIKIAGVKDFTFEEMLKATQGFDESMQIGQGGYGKVYKGVLQDGQVVAIKRALEGSLQGAKEFYNEIELLSRVHHRNLVSLVGYSDDEGEQMLVYEFMSNGTLRDNLNSNGKMPLDFLTRLQIALGSAKGILYLHTEANPPIYHRDIKASNILLDDKLRARVADFGLSKLAPITEFEGAPGGHVSTVVKGTPGYLDPEYFLTHKLTDKSDVYSFGVVLLELITGMHPISHGKNLVREVNLAYESGMILSIVDQRMGGYPSECMQPLLKLAIAMCKDDPDARPSMSEVVRELEAIWNLAPLKDGISSFEIASDKLSSGGYTTSQSGMFTSSSNPYVSSDVDASGLISGAIPSVAPR